jgi:hypothetical protein
MKALTAEVLPTFALCFAVQIPFWYMSIVNFAREDEQAAALTPGNTIMAGDRRLTRVSKSGYSLDRGHDHAQYHGVPLVFP